MVAGTVTLDPIAEQRLEDVLRAVPGVEAAWLLGSAARGAMRDDSDVDIALLLRPGVRLGAPESVELVARLATAAGRPVDLGVLTSGDVVYAAEAFLGGRILFLRDAVAALTRRAELLGMRADLERQRRPVIDAYTA